MRAFRSAMVAMRPTYTLDLIKPQTKNSQIVRSGERGGHGMAEDALPIHRPGNVLSSQERTVDA